MFEVVWASMLQNQVFTVIQVARLLFLHFWKLWGWQIGFYWRFWTGFRMSRKIGSDPGIQTSSCLCRTFKHLLSFSNIDVVYFSFKGHSCKLTCKLCVFTAHSHCPARETQSICYRQGTLGHMARCHESSVSSPVPLSSWRYSWIIWHGGSRICSLACKQ